MESKVEDRKFAVEGQRGRFDLRLSTFDGQGPIVTEDDPWEQAVETAQLYEAELMALRLREAGFDARVLDQSFRQEPLPNVRSFAVVRVLVPAGQAEAARRLLAQPVDMPPDIELVEPQDEDSGDEKS
jgi:hypothetical protein